MFNIYFKEMKKLFSLIALVGVIAACTPEQIDTAFKLAGGKVTVNVDVIDIIHGGAYAGTYTVNSNFGTVSGNTITYQAGDSQGIAAGDYTITVSGPKLAKDYTATFAVPEILAGGEAVIRASVFVGEPLNGWTVAVSVDEENVEEGIDTYFLANTHYPTHAYSHDGIDTWYYNNSEFMLEGTAIYNDIWWDDVITNLVDNQILGFEGIVDNVAESNTDSWIFEDEEYDFVVSAWAMWNVTQYNYWYKLPVTVFAFKDADEDGKVGASEETLDLGSFDWTEYETVLVQVHELPYPGAPGHAHYHQGHGHNSPGAMANAGGGISYNE